MKQFIIFYFIFYSFVLNAQQTISQVDSLQSSIKNLPLKKQLKAVVDISDKILVADLDKSKDLIKKYKDVAYKLKDSLSLGELYFKQSIICAYNNDLEQSIDYAFKAIKIFENKKDATKAGKVYGNLGYSLKTKDLEKALNYMRKGIKLLKFDNDLKAINPVFDNYGSLLLMANKKDSALYYQNKSLRIKKQLKDNFGIGFSYANIANTFLGKKNYKQAKIYIDSSNTIRNKIADTYGITVNYVFKAEIFMLEKNYQEAIKNFLICAVLAKKNKYHHLEQYCYENLATIYLENNDFKNAYLSKEKFQILKDSSDSVIKNTKIEELQIQYETEKKEKQLAEAKVDLLAKEAKIKKRTTFLISALALAFLLGLIGFLVYKQQRLKNRQIIKENQLKQALIKIENQNNLQEQRIEISKDLHDNIGSQLTFIISSLDNLKYFDFDKNKLYNKFDNISTFTRNTITDLRDTIWAMNKEEITFEDLQTRITNFIEAAKTSLLGITFEFNYTDNLETLSFNAKKGIDVYRIIQEAVNNAIKHSDASKIEVRLEQIENTIKVSILDDGKGFNPEINNAGNGLNSMKKRAEDISSQIFIEPLNPGTKVSFIL